MHNADIETARAGFMAIPFPNFGSKKSSSRHAMQLNQWLERARRSQCNFPRHSKRDGLAVHDGHLGMNLPQPRLRSSAGEDNADFGPQPSQANVDHPPGTGRGQKPTRAETA
jgi:hypothetical protein